jgi:hypothetical protein
MERELMYNPSNGKLLLTIAKVDGKVYQSYLDDGYIKIGTAKGIDIRVKGILTDDAEHNKICGKAIKQVIKDVENDDIAILGDWLNRLPTILLKKYIS